MSEPPEETSQSMPVQPRKAADFGGFYAGQAPWEIGRPQPAFIRLAEAESIEAADFEVTYGAARAWLSVITRT